jgi:hypothetical protein
MTQNLKEIQLNENFTNLTKKSPFLGIKDDT